LLLIGSLVLLVSNLNAPAQATAPAPTGATPAPAEHHHLVFKPTADDSGGVAPIQVGGGSRADKAADVVPISVLVPNNLALTTSAQPSLYWYQPSATKHFCEITVSEPKHPKPLLELKTSETTPAGIHAIRLTKFKVELKPNVIYQWSVALVLDPENRSGDIIARGIIKRVDPSPALAAKLAAASEADKAGIYAENGIWYDALQSISDQIDRNPQDKGLRDERAELLSQVGFKGKDLEETAIK
jgi:hypothetical protein